MKFLITTLFLVIFSLSMVTAQDEKVIIYNPKADAEKELKEAINKAKKEGKHVLLQIG